MLDYIKVDSMELLSKSNSTLKPDLIEYNMHAFLEATLSDLIFALVKL